MIFTSFDIDASCDFDMDNPDNLTGLVEGRWIEPQQHDDEEM